MMTQKPDSNDQQHPLYNRDRPLIDILLAQDASDYNLSELARLKIRYQGFPWGLTEDELFTKTRQIHHTGGIYKSRGKKEEEDWN
ncbi:MAG: hypothetical protein RLZZ86_2750 [Cyanobacteriota bacterium]